jgi:hypothetical protein
MLRHAAILLDQVMQIQTGSTLLNMENGVEADFDTSA